MKVWALLIFCLLALGCEKQLEEYVGTPDDTNITDPPLPPGYIPGQPGNEDPRALRVSNGVVTSSGASHGANMRLNNNFRQAKGSTLGVRYGINKVRQQ